MSKIYKFYGIRVVLMTIAMLLGLGARQAVAQNLKVSGIVKDETGSALPGVSVLINVTSTWFNRLVFDAGQPEEKRKTWVIAGPNKSEPLQASGLMGPVAIQKISVK